MVKYKTGEYTSTKTGKTCEYRSGWERAFMCVLDAYPDVVDWTYEPICIEYKTSKKRTRKYYPDFLTVDKDGTHTYIEVKPLGRSTNAGVLKKKAALDAYCLEHSAISVMLTEVELKKMGCDLVGAGGLNVTKKKTVRRVRRVNIVRGDMRVKRTKRSVDVVVGTVITEKRKRTKKVAISEG
jgi:hypothetical protein